MKKLHLTALLLLPFMSFAQKDTTYSSQNRDLMIDGEIIKKADREVDKKPEFEGGSKNFFKLFKQKFSLPYSAKNHKGPILITLIFTVTKDGSITKCKSSVIGTNITIQEDLVNESNRVLKKLPKWIPAEKNGQKVDYIQIMPFKIDMK